MYTRLVYTESMLKNITLSADANLIDEARRKANAQNATLNELFRAWLAEYVTQPNAADDYEQLMQGLRHVEAGRSFTRSEMNERR